MTNFHVMTAADNSVAPANVRRIDNSDVIEALKRGFDDFMSKPSHYVFVVIIYPIVGLILVRWAAGGNALQMIYPMVTGFALLGPLTAIGLYEISRRREMNIDTSWSHAFEVLRSPALPAIAVVGAMLMALFIVWLIVAQMLYGLLLDGDAPDSILRLVTELLSTPRGWMLIILGNLIGFCFAVVAFATTVVTFPLLLDRDIGARAAIQTSIRAVAKNPGPMLTWGAIVVVSLLLGSLPLFIGLAVVLPVLGHATWHLYRAVVENDQPSVLPEK